MLERSVDGTVFSKDVDGSINKVELEMDSVEANTCGLVSIGVDMLDDSKIETVDADIDSNGGVVDDVRSCIPLLKVGVTLVVLLVYFSNFVV